MPTETFMKLPEEKKQKITLAAKKELSRVPLMQASIKNIVEDAGIARRKFLSIF
jgi:transcriptional regulator, tetR family